MKNMPEFFEEKNRSVVDWEKIEKYRKQGDDAGLSMALIESHKLLIEFLKTNNYYYNDDFKDSLLLARKRFTDLPQLLQAYQVWQRLVNSREPITKMELNNAISAYQKAIYDLSSATDYRKPGLLSQIKSWIEINLINDNNRRNRFFLYFSSFLLLVFILDTSRFGRTFVDWLIGLIGGIAFWIFSICVGIILIVLIFVNLISFFEERMK
jgi:hypothetical protein